jgi:hypothetical protein
VVILRVPRQDAVHPQAVHTVAELVDDRPAGVLGIVDNRLGSVSGDP